MLREADLLGVDLASALDPVLFSTRAGIIPDPWQERLLRSAARNILVNCSRQSGKTTTTATLATHKAIYKPGSLTLTVSPAERQAKEMLRKCKDLLGALDRDAIEVESNTATWLEFANGSRIIALPGKEQTIRGFSAVDLLLIDEASRVLDDLYRAVRPMLAVSGGQLIAPSTPYGTRGWWYEAWEHGGDDWERYRVPASECPRISPEFLADESKQMGAWWFQQEYECVFLDAESAAFRREDIDAAFVEGLVQWEL